MYIFKDEIANNTMDWNKNRLVQRRKKNEKDSTQEKVQHGMTGISHPSYSTV